MTVLTLTEDHRKALIALAAIPDPEHAEPLNGIRIAGHQAVACDSYCIGVVDITWNVPTAVIVPAKPLAAALKMGTKDDPARLSFGDRQLTVTVGAPTLPLDDPDADEGLPDVAVELTYLDQGGWPTDMVEASQAREYGAVDAQDHHIVSVERLAKLAKLQGSDRVRLRPPELGTVWRVETPYSSQLCGFIVVSHVGRGAADEAA